MKLSISVLRLAEFVWRRGDINQYFDEGTSATEGAETHRRFQAKKRGTSGGYETEVSYKRTYSYKDYELTVSGRVDGLLISRNRRLGHSAIIEEVKTTRLKVEDKRAHDGSVHDAQVKLYAAMVCTKEQIPFCTTNLIYTHPDTMKSTPIREDHKSEELDAYFQQTCRVYLDWIEKMQERIAKRATLAKEQTFPFKEYLDDQHRLAAKVYLRIKDQENLLLTAPTGSGKSMTALFPALKSIGEGLVDRIVFITARTTGQQTGMDTLSILAKQNEELTYTNIIAKERICFTEGMPCEPEGCEYARGHFDRVREATEILLKRKTMDRGTIEAVARTAKVCPFELSLDAAEWADAVVCDYNYVFDPFVALARIHTFFFANNVLLIDEAHRLGERVKEMLCCELLQQTVESALQNVSDAQLSDQLLELSAFIAGIGDQSLFNEEETEVQFDLDTFWTYLIELRETATHPRNRADFQTDEMRDFFFVIHQFLTAKDRYSRDAYFWLIARDEDHYKLQLRCIDPSSWIAENVSAYRASVRISATLSPPSLYNEIHGLESDVAISQSSSLHRRLGVFVVPNVSTYYKDRNETAGSIVNIIKEVRSTCTGNWLVAFPSFVYLDLIERHFQGDPLIRAQSRDMSLDERSDFLEWLNEEEQRIGLVVTGGVFTESIDYDSETLMGVIVVGPALPPKSVELEKIKNHSENGFEFAYRLPSMARVVQAAGRVVRGTDDRGVVILIDPRFTREGHSQYFPTHWTPEIVLARDLQARVSHFWETTTRFSSTN